MQSTEKYFRTKLRLTWMRWETVTITQTDSAINAGLFFNTFIVASVADHYRFVEFWSQKAWDFSHRAWVILPLQFWSQILSHFCWKLVQYYFCAVFTTLHLFNTCFWGKMLKILIYFEISFTTFLPIRRVLVWKILEIFVQLSFLGLEGFF